MNTTSNDTDTRFRIIEVRRAASRGTDAIPFLIGCLADPSAAIADTAAAVLHALAPLAALPERWADDEVGPDQGPNVPEWLSRLCTGPASVGAFTSRCIETMRTLDQERLEPFLFRLAVYAGATRSLHAALQRSGMTSQADLFMRKVVSLRRAQFPLQMTLSTTMACQLACDFCIAEDDGYKGKRSISMEDFRALMDWMYRYGITRLNLSGGEPTLYHGFVPMLQEMKERSIELNIATNGLFSAAVRNEIIAARPLCVSFHHAPEVRGDRLDTYRENVRELLAAGIYAVIRCNLTDPKTDFRPFIETARLTGTREIRMAIPMPNSYRVNRYTKPAEFSGYRELLTSFVGEANAQGIEVRLSKPFPPCLLTEETARKFLANGSFTTSCPVHLTGYTNNLVIYPDLSYSPCLGLNVKVQQRIIEFPGLRAAALQYRRPVEALMRQPLFEHCAACPLSRGGRCVGACLSYRPDSLFALT